MCVSADTKLKFSFPSGSSGKENDEYRDIIDNIDDHDQIVAWSSKIYKMSLFSLLWLKDSYDK